MRLYRGPATGEKTHSVNLAVKVEAYTEEKGVVGVKGKRLETGEEVFVTLTDRGELAGNTNRPSLSYFRDKQRNLGVEIGGVIGFDRCWENGTPGKFLAGWPVWLIGSASEADMKRLKVNRPVTVEIRQGRTKDKLYGTLSVWQPENITEFDSLQRLEAATAKWLNDVQSRIKDAHGAALMRARNAAGEVVAYSHLFSRYDKERHEKEKKRFETGDTTITNFKATRAYEGFAKELTANGAVKFDIVPAVNLDISPMALQDGGESLKAAAMSYQRDGEFILKGTTFVMDPSYTWVAKFMPHDPYGDSGLDPALLGKGGYTLSYNAAFRATLTGEAAPASSQPPPPSERAESAPSINV